MYQRLLQEIVVWMDWEEPVVVGGIVKLTVWPYTHIQKKQNKNKTNKNKQTNKNKNKLFIFKFIRIVQTCKFIKDILGNKWWVSSQKCHCKYIYNIKIYSWKTNKQSNNQSNKQTTQQTNKHITFMWYQVNPH